jgi:hypothetical protein
VCFVLRDKEVVGVFVRFFVLQPGRYEMRHSSRVRVVLLAWRVRIQSRGRLGSQPKSAVRCPGCIVASPAKRVSPPNPTWLSSWDFTSIQLAGFGHGCVSATTLEQCFQSHLRLGSLLPQQRRP